MYVRVYVCVCVRAQCIYTEECENLCVRLHYALHMYTLCVRIYAIHTHTKLTTIRHMGTLFRSLVSRSAAAAGEAPRGAWRGGGLSCLRLEAAFPPSPLEGYIVSFKNS